MEIETNKKSEYDPNILSDLLRLYYKRLFPHKSYYRWLSYGLSESAIFTHREFSFTIDEVYIRFLSFENQSELEAAICTKVPHKIDVGAVFSIRPKDRRLVSKVQPVQKELVFDIDLTDYDEVRTCCKEAGICQKCWKFMVIAVRIIDAALRDDFGFEHILWVYSGRRGIHCWVCDKKARHMETRQRSCIAEYVQINTTPPRYTVIEKMHHSVRRAYRIIESMFEEVILNDQNLFSTPAGLSYLLQLIPDENIRKDLDSKLRSLENNSKIIWDFFVRYFSSLRAQGNQNRKLNFIIEEIQLILMYPRLDINVTKGFNHLLKSPFCVHPKTGRICIPFNPNAVAKFDPDQVPTVNQLLEEIDAFDEKSNKQAEEDGADEKARIKDYKKTGIFKGVLVFEEFIRKLEISFKGKAKAVSDAKMDF